MVKDTNLGFSRYSWYIALHQLSSNMFVLHLKRFVFKQITHLYIFKLQDRIAGVTVNVFASSVEGNVLEPRSGQT